MAKVKDLDELEGQVKPLIKNRILIAEMRHILDATKAVVSAADDMFKKYEANNKPDLVIVKAFEAKVDAATKLYETLEEGRSAGVEKMASSLSEQESSPVPSSKPYYYAAKPSCILLHPRTVV